jgi:hypothetical protein
MAASPKADVVASRASFQDKCVAIVIIHVAVAMKQMPIAATNRYVTPKMGFSRNHTIIRVLVG